MCEMNYYYYVTENGEYGESSLTAVIVTALCALNKRNIQMEAAATGIIISVPESRHLLIKLL